MSDKEQKNTLKGEKRCYPKQFKVFGANMVPRSKYKSMASHL